MKKILILIAILALIGIGYFISLHVSKEKPQTTDDVAIREILEQKSDAMDDGDVDAFMDTENSLNILSTGAFNPDARGSDRLHRGEGNVGIVDFNGDNKVVFEENFSVTNGPDYKVYLMTETVPETEDEFEAVRASSHNIGSMQQFSGYQTYDVPTDVDPSTVTGIVVWCERFGEFISSATLQ